MASSSGRISRKESGKQVSPPSPSLSTAEWTPTFSRGRPRPSNLHSNVRANPSFPTRQAARNTVYKLNENSNKMNTKHTRMRISAESNDSIMKDEEEKAHNSICLGNYGRVNEMLMETVDFLLRILQARKTELEKQKVQELLSTTGLEVSSDDAPAHVSSKSVGDDDTEKKTVAPIKISSKVSPLRNKVMTVVVPAILKPEHVVVQDASTEETSTNSTDAAVSSGELRSRSRSYEALVQLEAILEARHQQIMQDSVVEMDTVTQDSLRTNWETKKKSNLFMVDIQNEIRSIHHRLQESARSVDKVKIGARSIKY